MNTGMIINKVLIFFIVIQKAANEKEVIYNFNANYIAQQLNAYSSALQENNWEINAIHAKYI